MRQALAKTVRRDLRRAFGADAIEVFDQQSVAVESQDGILKAVRIKVAELERATTQQADCLDVVQGDVIALIEVNARPLWGRLRWLVTGR